MEKVVSTFLACDQLNEGQAIVGYTYLWEINAEHVFNKTHQTASVFKDWQAS